MMETVLIRFWLNDRSNKQQQTLYTTQCTITFNLSSTSLKFNSNECEEDEKRILKELFLRNLELYRGTTNRYI
jgi:hypothetical protein